MRNSPRGMRYMYKKRVRMPSMLDPHLADIEVWLGAEPGLTAVVILDRLAERCPGQFGPPQHTIVQRLLKALRRKAASDLIASVTPSVTRFTEIGNRTMAPAKRNYT